MSGLGMESMRMALRSLWSHKLRSTMTIMGVVIGVSSVLAVTTLGAAFEDSLLSNFDDIDDRSIFVTASLGEPTQGPPDAGQFGLIFTEVDRQNLLALNGVEAVNPAGLVAVSGLTFDGNELPFRTITATTPEAGEIRKAEDYATGGVFTMGEKEVVLGWAIAEQLGDGEALTAGTTISIGYPDGSSDDATVAGVLAEQDSLFGSNNGQVFAPVDPFYSVLTTSPTTGEKVRVYDGFTVFASSPVGIQELRDAVETYIEGPSDAAALAVEDLLLLVATPADIQGGISAAFDQATLFIAAIAGVSLLVGGIMIGTIMLISVTERTKEIGMMKAIGAYDRQILWTFLIEASLIGFIGSLIGIAAGIGAGGALVETLFDPDEANFVIPWDWVGISVAVGVGTGILAGLLPARRAVRIDPVTALGYE